MEGEFKNLNYIKYINDFINAFSSNSSIIYYHEPYIFFKMK